MGTLPTHTVDLRIEYLFDPESRNWMYVVPRLHISGNASSREEAASEAPEAIMFTLECDAADEASPDTEVERVRITVG